MIIFNESIDNLVEIFNISTKESKPFIFPTDTIYGIGASLSNIQANKLIYSIKKRPLNKPFPVLAGSIEQAEQIADISSLTKSNYNFMIENYNLYTTFILKAKNVDPLYMENNKIAVRIPARDILKKALLTSNNFITATSVNESGKEFMNKLSRIVKQLPSVDLFIYGKTEYGKSSYIFDISGKEVVKIR